MFLLSIREKEIKNEVLLKRYVCLRKEFGIFDVLSKPYSVALGLWASNVIHFSV